MAEFEFRDGGMLIISQKPLEGLGGVSATEHQHWGSKDHKNRGLAEMSTIWFVDWEHKYWDLVHFDDIFAQFHNVCTVDCFIKVKYTSER